MNIDRGTKLICIKDDEWPAWARAVMDQFPVKNTVYTVREIIPGVWTEQVIKDETGKNPLQFTGKAVPTVLLEELKNPVHPVSKKEMGFILYRFAEIPEQPKEKVKTVVKKPVSPKPVTPVKPKRKKKELVEI